MNINPTQENITLVNKVAAKYWQQEVCHDRDIFDSIEIIKCTEGKIMGFFSAYGKCPPVFYKIYFPNKHEEFINECKGLKTVELVPNVEGVQIPRVVEIDNENRAILLEKRNYDDTESGLKRFFIQTSNGDWNRVGLWLRNLHDLSVSKDKNPEFLSWALSRVEERMTRLYGFFTDEQLNKMEVIINSAINHFDTQSCEWVLSHRDFGLGNIKLIGSTVEIIDFQFLTHAPREYDILYFLIKLENTSYFPQSPRIYSSICKRFLDGYGMQFPVTPVYDFLYLLVNLIVIDSRHRRKDNYSWFDINKMLLFYFEWQSMRNLKKWLNEY